MLRTLNQNDPAAFVPDAEKISKIIARAMFPRSEAIPQRVAEIRPIVERCIDVRNQIEASVNPT
jgi:hypothetical protein